MSKTKKTSAERRANRFKYNWTNQDLEREVAKLDDTVELYWHYNDELGRDEIAKIVDDGQEGLDEVYQELESLNCEELWRLQDSAIESALESMRMRGEVSAKTERRFRALIEESGKLLIDVNLKGLAKCTGAGRFTVLLKEPEIAFQAWRGVRSKREVDDLCALCAILNVNPAHLQPLVTADNDDRPSYDPEPVVFPNHPERDGQEYVALKDFLSEIGEVTYGGGLVFMFALDLVDLIKDPDAYRNGPLKIRAGTLGLIYEYCNGAGSTAEMPLKKDLILPAGSYVLSYDSARRYGLQSCYGFTGEPWKQGSVEPATEEQPTIQFPPSDAKTTAA